MRSVRLRGAETKEQRRDGRPRTRRLRPVALPSFGSPFIALVGGLRPPKLAKSGPETIAIHSGPPSVDGNESKITLRLRPGPVNGECTPRSMQHGQRLS